MASEQRAYSEHIVTYARTAGATIHDDGSIVFPNTHT